MLNHSQSSPTSSLIFQPVGENSFRRKIVDGVGFDAKCRPGPTIHPEKYDANLSTFNSPPFYLSPRRASRQYSTQKEHKFRIFYSKAAISRFFRPDLPVEGRGREIGVATRSRFLFPAVCPGKD